MNPLISVIVPIYNVEKYLARCVDSIVNQTYKNLEIILIDDGSPDLCPQMCDDYAEKDSRIKVVHKKNGGLSDARNAGMAVATGEYISFIDSDDYVSDDFFECLLDVMNKENSDIAECSVVKFYEDNRFDEFSDDLSVKTYDTQDAMSALIAENPFHQHVWNKLYKTKLVNIRRLDALEGKANRQKYIENNFPDLSTQSKIDLYGSCMFAYQSVLKFMSGADKKKAISIIKKYKKNCNLSFDEINTIKDSSKKYFMLAKFNFCLCCKIKSVFKIGF